MTISTPESSVASQAVGGVASSSSARALRALPSLASDRREQHDVGKTTLRVSQATPAATERTGKTPMLISTSLLRDVAAPPSSSLAPSIDSTCEPNQRKRKRDKQSTDVHGEQVDKGRLTTRLTSGSVAKVDAPDFNPSDAAASASVTVLRRGEAGVGDSLVAQVAESVALAQAVVSGWD